VQYKTEMISVISQLNHIEKLPANFES